MALREQVASSFKWNTLNVVVISLVQILRMSVLARILDVSDFGLMAIALMVISFTEIFSDLGFTIPLIHRQNITENEYSSVFWFNLLLSVIIYALLYLFAPIVSNIYKETELTPIIRIIGVTIIINAFGKIFQTIKTKEFCFKFISIVSILTALLGFFVTFIFALWGYGVYSLVIGTVSQILVRQVIYFFSGIKESRVKFHFSWGEVSSFVKMGSYQVGAQVFDFFAAKIDIILLGKLVGMEDLGIYNLAKELVLKITSFSSSIFRTVMTPTIAKIQDDIERVKSVFSDYSALFAICMVPVFACFCIFSKEVCMIMYGEKWELISDVLFYLSIYGVFNALTIPNSTLQLAFGRTDLSFLWTIIIFVVGSVVTIIAGQFGFMYIVFSQVFLSIFLFILSKKVILNNILQYSILEYLSFSKFPIAVCLFLGVPIVLVSHYLHPSLIMTGLLFVGFCALYIMIIYLKKKSIVKYVLDFVKR